MNPESEKDKILLAKKSGILEIQQRFDGDVERFSNLETGQSATIDAPLAMELIVEAAMAATPHINKMLDIGCGAGNNTLKLLQAYGRNVDCDLNDLSRPMLNRAHQRISQQTQGQVNTFQGDFRSVDLVEGSYDVVLAAAVLHHLRDDKDWQDSFAKIFRLLKPGGSFWITDLVSHEHPGVQKMMWNRYGDHLQSMGGDSYKDQVFAYIEQEDSPRPVSYQLALLTQCGFAKVELLHKNSCFAAFGGIKALLDIHKPKSGN